MRGNVLEIVSLWFVSHIAEKLDRILHRFKVADIKHPKTLDTKVVGKRKLLKHLLCLCDIQPFRVTGSTHIVNVVINSPTTNTFMVGHTADVAPVVVAEQDNHIFGHFETCIVILLNLFVESPNLLTLCCGLSCFLGYNFALIVDYALHKFLVLFQSHHILIVVTLATAKGSVAVATHTNGNKVFVVFAAADALAEKLIDNFLISIVIPSTVGTTAASPLLMVASHRFVVRCSHNNAHCRGSLAVFGVVGIKSVTPHSWPHKVGFQAEQKFKHLGVKLTVHTICKTLYRRRTFFIGESIVYPSAKAGSLIV